MSTEQNDTGGQPNNDATPVAAAAAVPTTLLGAADAEGKQQEGQADATKADDKSAEAAKDEGAKEDEKPSGAPEAYEDFAAPEGVELDADAVGEFKTVAKELNLSQADAQKVVDLGPKMMAKWQERQTAQMGEAVAQWGESTTKDKEIGGDKLKENLAVANRALTAYGTPELKTLLNESGLGNHPEIIRVLYRAGKAISEDTVVTGSKGGFDPSGAAQRMYPNMNP